MRVLVTGGAGFIGARLCGRLLEAGHEVVVLDDLSSGRESALPSTCTLIRSDIAHGQTADLIQKLAPRAMIHLAAQVSVPQSYVDPIRDLQVNLEGTINVLAGARRARAERVVFASSGGAAYGEVADEEGASETALPMPVAPYGIHKVAAERHVAISGMSYAVARLSNVYGPGQRSDLEGGVVAIFADRARSGLDLEVHGSGNQTRDFVHVDDVVGALVAMLESPMSGVWNVGTGQPTSINVLAGIAAAAAERPIHVRRGRARHGDVTSSLLNVSKIARELGWKPQLQLSSELPRLIHRRA